MAHTIIGNGPLGRPETPLDGQMYYDAIFEKYYCFLNNEWVETTSDGSLLTIEKNHIVKETTPEPASDTQAPTLETPPTPPKGTSTQKKTVRKKKEETEE